MSFQSEFVNPMRLSRRYQEWAADSPGDLIRFNKYSLDIAAGIRPAIPVMATQFGKALIGAGKPWLPAAVPPPAPPPVTALSVFAGRGCFTAHDPEVLIRKGVADRFDWVALKGDGGDHSSPLFAAVLRAAGVKWVHIWYSWDGPSAFLPALALAAGWIGQAEGPDQLRRATDAGYGPHRALVTNNYMSAIPAGWDVLAEAFWNVTAAANPGSVVSDSLNRGAKTVFPVFGVGGPWAEAYCVVPLEEYVRAWSPTNWSVYLGEYLTPADIAYLKALPR